MSFLVLGYSSLARRRILPALGRLGIRADVASHTRSPASDPGISGRTFADYAVALSQSDAQFVYVSTRNHDHARWVKAALDAGRHVIVDKPAALTLVEVEDMVARAASSGRFIAEATTWISHPQVERLRALVADAGPVTRIVSVFSFPPLPEEDARYRREWGGGALWDLGPYAVSPGRVFFDAPPEQLTVALHSESGREVETGFTVLGRYPGGRHLAGHFGYNTAYVNRLDVIGPRVALSLERAFTTDAALSCRIRGQLSGQPIDVEIPAADAFARFLSQAMQAARDGGGARYAEAMVSDARAIEKLRSAAR